MVGSWQFAGGRTFVKWTNISQREGRRKHPEQLATAVGKQTYSDSHLGIERGVWHIRGGSDYHRLRLINVLGPPLLIPNVTPQLRWQDL